MAREIDGVIFSDRELEVLSCICHGCTSEVTATLLKISVHTVDYHIENIKNKMTLYSRARVVTRIQKSADYQVLEALFSGISNPERYIMKRFSSYKKWIFVSALFIIACLVVVPFFSEENVISYEIPLLNERVMLPRDNVISQIRSSFKGKQKLAFVVLIGAAGIGKTTIARNYIKKNYFAVKGEIDSESEFKIVESIEGLGFLLVQNDEDRNVLSSIRRIMNLAEKRRMLKIFIAKLLSRHKSWCLIYDNAVDLNVLKQWLPSDDSLYKNGRVIITTKNENVKNMIFPYSLKIIKVPQLSYNEEEELFFRILNRRHKHIIKQKPLVKVLFESIPSIPLDVSTAAYFIELNEMDLSSYLKLISLKGDSKMDNLRKNNLDIPTRDSIVATTFSKILEDNPKYFDMLLMLCLLDSQDINKKYFTIITPSEGEVESFFYTLKKYSMLDSENNTFMIHRLTQDAGLSYLLGSISKHERGDKLRKIVDALSVFKQIEWKWSKSDKRLQKGEGRQLIPHLESMLTKIDDYKSELENADEFRIKLLNTLYFAYNGKASYKEVYDRGRELIKLNEKSKILRGEDFVLSLLQHVYVSIYAGEFSEVEQNAKTCLKICETAKNIDHLKMGAMLYLMRYYFDFISDYQKAEDMLSKVFEFKNVIKPEDWEIVKCVFANQLYRSYEAYYVNDREKILEAIKYLKQMLKEKGFVGDYRRNKNAEIPLDKTVFIMYAIEMMINISRGYNVIGDYKEALENELDIRYIYDFLRKEGMNFHSQEFQFNTVYGETLLRLGKLKEAHGVLSKAIDNKADLSSEMDLFCGYVSRAEVNKKLNNLVEARHDRDSALSLPPKKSRFYEVVRRRCERIIEDQ